LTSTVGALLEEGALALSRPHVEEPAREAQILLGHALGVSRAWLVAHRDDVLSAEKTVGYRGLLQGRREGRPVAYLTGSREFHGLDFRVTPAVLIPRGDTETLVDAALHTLAETPEADVLDLGTGSGCIAVVLAHRLPGAHVTAVETSAEALRVARDNASAHQARVEFLRGDWFVPVGNRKFDLVVSNPPYIPAGDPHLERGDLRFEPRDALVAGPDGLDAIRRIVASAPAHLRPGGWLLLEHGHDQADACASLLAEAGFGQRTVFADLAGIRRVAGGRLVHPASSR
jgi:release factor glutamine methyltransferase